MDNIFHVVLSCVDCLTARCPMASWVRWEDHGKMAMLGWLWRLQWDGCERWLWWDGHGMLARVSWSQWDVLDPHKKWLECPCLWCCMVITCCFETYCVEKRAVLCLWAQPRAATKKKHGHMEEGEIFVLFCFQFLSSTIVISRVLTDKI